MADPSPDQTTGPTTDRTAVGRAHGYHPLLVIDVVQETADTRTFVLDQADAHRDLFTYRPGQFCTFRVTVDGDVLYRSYSMSTAPGIDEQLAVTVKRVPDGRVSGWFHDAVAPGQVLHVSPPSGVFCLPEADEVDGTRPVVAFAGGSGVTPIMSIAKAALTTTTRRVRLLDANRDESSVIFRRGLDDLAGAHDARFDVHHHLDDVSGLITSGAIRSFLGDDTDADVFICGPAPFMDLVEATLREAGVDPGRINIERFINTTEAKSATPVEPTSDALDDQVDGEGAGSVDTGVGTEGGAATDGSVPDVVTVILKGKTHEIGYHPGDTILETTRRGALTAPSSCEAGNCATCMALCKEGAATMRVNNALTPDEVAEGWVLTCQAVPDSAVITVEYEAY